MIWMDVFVQIVDNVGVRSDDLLNGFRVDCGFHPSACTRHEALRGKLVCIKQITHK